MNAFSKKSDASAHRQPAPAAWPSRYFFTPESPQPLAICRIIVCGWLFVYYGLLTDFRGWNLIATTHYDRVGLFGLLGHNATLSDTAVGVLQSVFALSLLGGMFGLMTRASLITAAVLAFYFLGLRTAFGKVSHSEPIVIFMLVTLAMSHCNAAFSLDRRFGWFGARKLSQLSGEYRWPIRVVWILMTIVFSFAGWQKVRLAGLSWVSPESFTPMMLGHFYDNDPLVDWGIQLAYFKPFVWMAGIMTLVGECLFPLVLVSRKARLFFVPLMFGMQANIALLFGVYFWPFLPAYAFFVPWAWLIACYRAKRILAVEAVPA